MDEEIKIEGNIDINKALQEFEEKSKIEQAQKAPEVSQASELPRMVRWVMKLSGGAITEQRQAEYVLLGFAIVIFGISIFLFLGGPSLFQKKAVPRVSIPGAMGGPNFRPQ